METKQCFKCKQHLSLDQFYVRSDSGKLTSECKACRKVRSGKHYVENLAQHKALVKRRYDTFGRYARYGLSVEDYDAMLVKQGNGCALCGAEKPGGKGKWHIDHVGGTNPKVNRQCASDAVRGLLCHRCNISLGHYEQLLKRVGETKVLTYIHRKE
jgi:hypothetical protein